MIDRDGHEWLPVLDAARTVRVRESAIYVWKHRGRLGWMKHRGRLYVRMVDVMAAEAEWRQRVTH